MSALDCCPDVKKGEKHGKDCPYFCSECDRRKGVGCSCGLSFAERMKNIQFDREALRRFHRG